MKRAVFILFFIKVLLFGYIYNDFLLKAQASILPKILLLDNKIDSKLFNNRIKIEIVFDKEDLNAAFLIRSYIEEFYKDKIGNYILDIEISEIGQFLNENREFSSIFVLKTSKENYLKILEKIKDKNVLSFVYDKNDLKYGFLLSIDLEDKPIIYINRESINKNIDFIPQLFQIARLI